MAYVTMNEYDADLRIPGFTGIMQYGDGINADIRTASEAINMDTVDGILQPMGACTLLTPAVPDTIETLACLYRRWYTGPDGMDVFIAAAGGQLYFMIAGSTAWTRLPLPAGWTGGGYASNVWSFAAYEINPEGSTAPVDVLLLSNAKDGMVCVRGDNMTVITVPTPKKFGVIARYAERIWGGGIPDDPDMLVYSAPFDPMNWEANQDMPEDGAGDVLQPSWDGDSFHALTPLGSQLIAFKKNRIWRIMNTDPSEYVFKEQYGGGTAYFNTIAVDGERILMLGENGIMQYDGLAAVPYCQEYCKAIYAAMNKSALHEACACIFRDVYYCALPAGTASHNNMVLMYHTKENTWLLRNDVCVESFLPTGSKLYFTSHDTPGRIWEWGADAWTSGAAASGAKWVGPWQDFNQKTVRKGGFELYLTLEAKSAGSLTLAVETENKIKRKTLEYAAAEGAKARQRRIRFCLSGRRFRLIIQSEGTAAWRIAGGIQIHAGIDAD